MPSNEAETAVRSNLERAGALLAEGGRGFDQLMLATQLEIAERLGAIAEGGIARAQLTRALAEKIEELGNYLRSNGGEKQALVDLQTYCAQAREAARQEAKAAAAAPVYAKVTAVVALAWTAAGIVLAGAKVAEVIGLFRVLGV